MKTWLACFGAVLVVAPISAQNSLYEKGQFTSDGVTLNYRLLKPQETKDSSKVPLVVFLHGAGERGDDNERQLTHGSALFTQKENCSKYPAFVLFPQCPNGKRWCEVDWSAKMSHTSPKEPSTPMKLTRQLIDKLVKEQPIDANRIYVIGLSMGGFGTWDFLVRYPELAAAGVPICGGADNAAAEKIKTIPIWAFHGGKDTVVWPERTRSAVETLKKLGSPVRYTEYPNAGHNAWTPAFAEAELLSWMFAQKRK